MNETNNCSVGGEASIKKLIYLHSKSPATSRTKGQSAWRTLDTISKGWRGVPTA